MKSNPLASVAFGIMLFGCSQTAAPTDALVAATQAPLVVLTSTNTTVSSTSTPRPMAIPIPTTTEIVPGAVLFEEDFEGGNMQNFVYIWGSNWKVSSEHNGNRVLEINTNTEGDIKDKNGAYFGFGAKEWLNYSAKYDGVSLNINDDLNGWIMLKDLDYSVWDEKWYQVKVEAQGPWLRVYLDDNLVLQAEDSSIASGGFELGVFPGTHALFDDIRIISLDEAP